jgi:hypothetical protein
MTAPPPSRPTTGPTEEGELADEGDGIILQIRTVIFCACQDSPYNREWGVSPGDGRRWRSRPIASGGGTSSRARR